MDGGAWTATVQGVTDSLSTTEWVEQSSSFHIIVNLFCVKYSARISSS